MSTATPRESRRSSTESPLVMGFVTELESLTKRAKVVETLSAKTLRGNLKAHRHLQPHSIVKEIDNLSVHIQRVRDRLQALDAKAPTPNADRTIQNMVRNGELLESAKFVEKTGFTRQALSKALGANRVFFIEMGGARYFPAFFTDARYERKQLETVSKILGDLPGGAKLQFFMNPKGSLGGVTPLEALLHGQLAGVRSTAEGFAKG